MTLQDILSRLEGVKRNGDGFKARCPAHHDNKPSLSVSVGEDGKILFHCFAGCSPEDVAGAIGLTMKDLFQEPQQKARSTTRQLTATYRYTDATGNLIAEKLRYSDKSFLWRRREGNRWVFNRKGITIPLYNLPAVVAAETVYLVEGEKDVNTLQKSGRAATTLPDGSQTKWRNEYAEALKGKAVYILPDNDDPGQKYARMCASHLKGIAAKVKVLDLLQICPALPKKGDVSDVVTEMGMDILETLETLADYTEEWETPSTADEETSLKPADYSDAGNATVFVREYRKDLVFTDSMGWLYWDGKRWERNEHKALELAQEFSSRMLEEAKEAYSQALHNEAEAKANNPDGGEQVKAASEKAKRAKSFFTHANQTRNSSKIRAILDMSKPYFVRPGNSMDADPWELNTPDGIVNLVSGECKPNRQESYCTMITAQSSSEDGTELWQNFLDLIVCGDDSLKGFLQLVTGMSLFGKVYEESVVFAVGGGRNGKSTFFNAVGAVLGDYTGYINIDVITTRGANDKAALATLRGKRFVIAGELEEGRYLSAATIKKIASTDPFQVEEKYKQPETVIPSHTLCLFTNHLPRVSSTDDGTWRRIKIIPFNAVIKPDKSKQNYGDYLAEHAGGAILAWALEGARNFARNGFHLDIPECVAEATEEYRERENWLENFIEECCCLENGASVQAKDLYDVYYGWAHDRRDKIRTTKEFHPEMDKISVKLGIYATKRHGLKWYKGIKTNRQNYDYMNGYRSEVG